VLTYQPKIGSVIFCDYRGFVVPEMVKKRPVIVVSKHRDNSRLLLVVPISTTQPIILRNYHLEIDAHFCSNHLSGKKSWVKCDMINMVSLDRLHLVRANQTGQRYSPQVGSNFIRKIKDAIKIAHSL